MALDPQGNGASVAWDNPQSGAKGSFVALAPPFLENDRICRAFKASVSAAPAGQRRLGGSACRTDDGDWVLAEVKEHKIGKRRWIGRALSATSCPTPCRLPT